MTSFYDNYDYYKKMLELQEKLRKSEEERIRLEERFKILVQESRNRHDACINRLRLRYIEFLEEQRTRDERNHKLLEALDRVDNDLALMTAKTDKLNALRKQYEAYLHRIYTVPSPSTNIIDGGNVTNLSEDRYLRRNAIAKQISLDVENTTPSQLLWLDGHKSQSISLLKSKSKSTKSTENTCNDYYQQNNTQPRILSQPISNKNIYPSISQNNEMIKQPVTQSLQNFEQKQSYVQIDPHLHIPRVSSGRLCSLNQQTSSHYNFNKPLTQRMEISQTASHFTVPERTNGNISPYTSLNVSQNRFAPMTLDYVRPSNVQSFQQKSNKVSLHDMETQTRCVGAFPNETSSVYTISTPVERNICCMSSLNKSPNLSKQASPRYFDYSWKKPDHFRSRHKSISGASVVRPLVTSGIDNTMRRYKCFTPETNTRLSARQSAAEQEKSRTTTIVENELDRYIDKIRRLHRDLDAQSLEEIEQERDIGGNTLDVSLSDDNLSEVPTGDQSKENLPKEVEKVLALADDLASRSVDLDVANESGKGRVNKNRSVELVQTAKDGTPILERNYVAFSDTRNDRKTSAALAKHEISEDIKLHETKLDSHQNVENSGKENPSDTLEHYEQKLPEMDEQVDFMVPSGDKVVEQDIKNITSKNIQREEYDEKDGNIYIAAESNLDQYWFDIAEELEPWDLDVLQKRIKEVDLIHEAENQFDKNEIVTPNQDNAKQTEPLNEMKTTENEENKKDSNEDTNGKDVNSDIGLEQKDIECLESKEELASENKISEISISQDEKDKSYTTNENIVQNIEPARDQINEQNEFDNEQKQEADEINVTSTIAQGNEQDVQDYEYSNENYYEDSNQAENYAQNYETEYTGLNEGYNYDQNASYENNQDQENYDQNMSYNADQEQNYDPNTAYEANQDGNYNSNALYDADQRQNYDPNASYKTDRDQNYEQNVYESNQGQEYQEYINQEYVQGSSEQYGEYAGEQYGSENQYEHDPNVQYQENADQQYAYAYNQQYDSNQENNPNINQSFAYSDYDPNQAQLVQEESKPNEELQEEPKHEEAKGKVDTAQSKDETSVSEDGKKKKDVIKSLLDSDTDSTIERNVSNTESDFDFN
ncbi:hypothetical protein QLX08_004321 [Tetragonisca angustula]|uniref:Uncharacterized protein n=1 Tax=Tetragonisca angustula TaxID=166442 RepID=A0AAW1A5B6_9HYME